MNKAQQTLFFKIIVIGLFTIANGLSGLEIEEQEKMGGYSFQGTENLIAQADYEPPMVTILRPAPFSSSDTSLRKRSRIDLSEKKHLGVLLFFLGVAAEEAV